MSVASASHAQVPALVVDIPSATTIDAQTDTGLVVRVRLIGTAAPDSRECGSGPARQHLEDLTLGRRVSLVPDPALAGVDDGGRSLSYVDRDDGLDVGLEMVRSGFAELAIERATFARQQAYFDADGVASGEGAGLWTTCGGEFHRPAAQEQRAQRRSAIAFVRRYYHLISKHRYATAWPLLPREVRRKLGGSFAVWKAGHRGSIGASVRSAAARMSGDRAVVTVALRGGQRDACSGRLVRMSFRGRWVLAPRDGGWVAVAQHIHKTGGGRVRLTQAQCAPPPPPRPAPAPPHPPSPPATDCQGYSPCIPPGSDVDCSGGSGDGPRYTGPVRVNGSDPYGLDSDGDGFACES